MPLRASAERLRTAPRGPSRAGRRAASCRAARHRRRPATSPTRRRGGHGRCAVRDGEEAAAEALDRAGVVGHRPRDRVQAVVQQRRVEDPEADRAVRVVEAGEQRLDVRPRVVVVGGADVHAVDQHANRRAVDGNRLRLRRQRPAEVHEAACRRRCPPWCGVSSVPNGNVALAFAHVIVRVPEHEPVAPRDPARAS